MPGGDHRLSSEGEEVDGEVAGRTGGPTATLPTPGTGLGVWVRERGQEATAANREGVVGGFWSLRLY